MVRLEVDKMSDKKPKPIWDYQIEYIKSMLQFDKSIGLELLKLNRKIEPAKKEK